VGRYSEFEMGRRTALAPFEGFAPRRHAVMGGEQRGARANWGVGVNLCFFASEVIALELVGERRFGRDGRGCGSGFGAWS